jgi:hypothetical protein
MDEKEWKHRRPQKAYKRPQRKKQIIKQLMLWLEDGYASEATSYQLAKALELNASPHFRNILNEMVDEGILTATERDQSGRYTTRFYALAHGADIITRNVNRRVNVKHKGVVSGQLEMWS